MAQGFRKIKNKDKLLAKAMKLIKAGKSRDAAAKAIKVSELTLRRWLRGIGVKPLPKGRPRSTAVDYTKANYCMPKSISPTGKVGKKLVKSFLDAVMTWAKEQKRQLG